MKQQSVTTAQGVLLLTAVCTLVNGILRVCRAEFAFFYASVLPDFAGKGGGAAAFAVAAAAAVLLYGALWLLSRRHSAALLLSAFLLCADLCLCGVEMVQEGVSVLRLCGLLFHALAVALLIKGYLAEKQIQERKQAEQATVEMLTSMQKDGEIEKN